MAVNISIGNTVIYTVSDAQLAVLAYNNSKAQLVNIFRNFITGLLDAKVDEAKKELQNDWIPIIRQRYNSMPTQDLDIANLIYSQPDYKDYDHRNS